MVDFLIHYYKRGEQPCRSLSTLPDAQAVAIMRELYVEGSVFWERFKDPEGYLGLRRQVERTLHDAFIEKGGLPKQSYPVYFMLGRPRWVLEAGDAATIASTEELVVPLSLFDEREVSFTYPDSMVSALMVVERNPAYYEPDYHGQLFTRREIEEIIAKRGLPGEGWETKMPKNLAHYIEVQVWNDDVLEGFRSARRSVPQPGEA